MKNLKDLLTFLTKELETKYPHVEAREMSYRLIWHFFRFSKVDMALYPEIAVDVAQEKRVSKALERLKQDEPLQYVLGTTEFYDLSFYVNSNVLIPRPETEELVHLIIDRHRGEAVRILDIGTGSGCIPIALKRNIKNVKVAACDVSLDALSIARKNADLNFAEVDFFQCDILEKRDWQEGSYDVIVSNPPYVTNSEKEAMRPNVLKYEPHLALFVEDHDPLLFYITIADYAMEHLTSGGSLYFEINEAYGLVICTMLIDRGFVNVELFQDIFEKDRMVKAIKP